MNAIDTRTEIGTYALDNETKQAVIEDIVSDIQKKAHWTDGDEWEACLDFEIEYDNNLILVADTFITGRVRFDYSEGDYYTPSYSECIINSVEGVKYPLKVWDDDKREFYELSPADEWQILQAVAKCVDGMEIQ